MKPEDDALVDEALEILGDDPYLLWNCMDGVILFAVSKTMSLLIQGQLEDGKIYHYNVTKIGLDNLLNIKSDWMGYDPTRFAIAHSELVFGEMKFYLKELNWEPRHQYYTDVGKWFHDPANAVWIIADMIFAQQQSPVKSNFASSDLIDDPIVRKQRYIW
jgi:hypothetical protein